MVRQYNHKTKVIIYIYICWDVLYRCIDVVDSTSYFASITDIAEELSRIRIISWSNEYHNKFKFLHDTMKRGSRSESYRSYYKVLSTRVRADDAQRVQYELSKTCRSYVGCIDGFTNNFLCVDEYVLVGR
jgi:hypothetical protein